jgi:ABC-type sugar transport system ATPase subunit
MKQPDQPSWSIRNLAKSFRERTALAGVSLDLFPGEVLALLGENGAGKSTLAKILAGVVQPDGGDILKQGRSLTFQDPAVAHKAGVAVLFEEPALAANLSVAENLFLGIEIPGVGGALLDWPAMRRSAGAQLEELGFAIDPASAVDQLSPFEQRLVEAARAFARRPTLLVLDEPCAGLGAEEIRTLHAIIRRAAQQGAAVLYLSDLPEEALSAADRAAVLREGQVVVRSPANTMGVDEAVSAMAGFDARKGIPRVRQAPGGICLEARGLRSASGETAAGFELRSGEVLGLSGPGAVGIARAVAGLDHPVDGSLLLNGRRVVFKNQEIALRAGVGITRVERGPGGCLLHLEKSAGFNFSRMIENIQAPFLDIERFGGFQLPRQTGVSPGSVRRAVRYLAGAGPEKKRVARWLTSQARVLILIEPTRGLAAGARLAFFRAVDEMAAAGLGLIIIDSNPNELQALSDRIMEVS